MKSSFVSSKHGWQSGGSVDLSIFGLMSFGGFGVFALTISLGPQFGIQRLKI